MMFALNWQRRLCAGLVLFGVIIFVLPVQAVYEGKSAEIGQFPWFVRFSGCGGVLIEAEWVLTARHCVSPSTVGAIVRVKGHDADPIERQITQVVEHSANQLGISNDLAIVRLSEPITTVEPVLIPDSDDLDTVASSSLLTVGQGHIRTEYVLKQDNLLPTLDDLDANHYVYWYKQQHTPSDESTRYNDTIRLNGSGASSTTLLAGIENAELYPTHVPGGTCHGDSGGGLIYQKVTKNGIKPTVIGVVSSIDYCAEMAVRKLYERDADGSKTTLTLPNGVVQSLPASYQNDVEAGQFGYTRYTNVTHDTFRQFIFCHIPQLDTAERTTIVTGTVVLENESTASDRLKQLGKTEITLAHGDTKICVTSPNNDGRFTMTLPTNLDVEEITLTIESTEYRLIEFTNGELGIHGIRGTSADSDIPTLKLTAGEPNGLQPVSIYTSTNEWGNYILKFRRTDRFTPFQIVPGEPPYKVFMPFLPINY